MREILIKKNEEGGGLGEKLNETECHWFCNMGSGTAAGNLRKGREGAITILCLGCPLHFITAYPSLYIQQLHKDRRPALPAAILEAEVYFTNRDSNLQLRCHVRG